MNDSENKGTGHDGTEQQDRAAEWRARASQAEEQLRDAHDKLVAAERELSQANAAAEQADLRRRIERALADAGAIDVDVAGVLIEASLAGVNGPKPTVQVAVQELRKNKAFLFAGQAGSAAASGRGAGAGVGVGVGVAGGVMSGAVRTDRHASLSELADTARGTGDRGSLLRYLRAKRGR